MKNVPHARESDPGPSGRTGTLAQVTATELASRRSELGLLQSNPVGKWLAPKTRDSHGVTGPESMRNVPHARKKYPEPSGRTGTMGRFHSPAVTFVMIFVMIFVIPNTHRFWYL